MTLYADDPGPAEAERIAREWCEGPDWYTGRRRAHEDGTPMRLDDETMADLIAARVAHWLGDHTGHDTAEQHALLRLYDQGHTWTSAHATIRAAEPDIADLARVRLDLLRLDQAQDIGDMWTVCPDPGLHGRWDVQAGRTEASRMRVARGRCGWCGLPIPRRTR